MGAVEHEGDHLAYVPDDDPEFWQALEDACGDQPEGVQSGPGVPSQAAVPSA